MSTETTPETSADVAAMDEFISSYGVEEALEGIDTSKEESAAPASPEPQGRREVSADDGGDEGDGGAELDASTLQALGLTPEGEPTPAGESKDDDTGTARHEIDLESLATTLGVDPKDLTLEKGELKVRTKVDGDEKLTPFKKLREGYQLREHFTRQNEEFLQQKQRWAETQQKQQTELNQAAGMAYEVLQSEEKTLQARYTRNWTQLRQDDPAEYAAQVAEYNQQLGQLKQRQQALVTSYRQRQQQQQQERQQSYKKLRDEGKKKLAETLGWNDEKAFAENGYRLRQYLTSKGGLTDKEVNGTVDPRLFAISEKARKYDDLMGKVDLARKKVSATHKVPSGSSSKPAGGKKRQRADAIKRLQTDHSVEAAADVFKNLGIA